MNAQPAKPGAPKLSWVKSWNFHPDSNVEPDTLHLLDTSAVETEAAIASAGEELDAEICDQVNDFYRHCLSTYDYVKEANDKFLAMLDNALSEDISSAAEQDAIRRYAESLLLDPVDQPINYESYLQEDIVDEAEDLTNREAWMDVKIPSD
jgi:hypothetical protein